MSFAFSFHRRLEQGVGGGGRTKVLSHTENESTSLLIVF